jgi:hypothetical protein
VANIPKGYKTELWSITFQMRHEETGEPLLDENGEVRLFRECDVDWSFLELDDIDDELLFEVNENGDRV